jgi:hypothetical protein
LFSRCLRFTAVALTLAILATTANSQSVPEPESPDNSAVPMRDNSSETPPIPAGPLVVVHGVVKNAASGEPLPRTLVQVDGETGPGTLTDGDGKFELTLPGLGPHNFQLTKPGFHDLPPNPAGTAILAENAAGITHNVFVTEEMPPVSFAMTPTGVIHGRIDLSTGDPGQGIGVLLLRKTLQGGHVIWRSTENTRTNSDGAYRFAGLDESDYAIATEPARDSDIAGNLVTQNSDGKVAWSGYAAAYYPDAREFSGAAKFHLRSGETVQANLTLKLEPFYLVRASLPPAKGDEKSAVDYAPTLLDTQGRSLPYPAQYEAETRTVQAMLPDGNYSLQVTALKRHQLRFATARNGMDDGGVVLQGTTDFTVSGHPISSLRASLAQRASNPLVVSVTRAPGPRSSGGSIERVFISVSQAVDSLVDGMWTEFAHGTVPGQLDTTVLAPGSYWVHTSIGQPGLCEASFTAGGASLAREPLAVGSGGATAPLALSLRDDCAKLTLNMPVNLQSPVAGEEPAYTVYVVPDFDSTVDSAPMTLRPSSGSITLDNLTPGSYHVYTFPGPVEMEYRNREALAALPNAGQTIALDPSSNATLIVEAPAR